jgi:hypothetical protein
MVSIGYLKADAIQGPQRVGLGALGTERHTFIEEKIENRGHGQS